MRFEWDPAKSERNRRERGFDFDFATLAFEGPTLLSEDLRRDYGERRFRVLGIADGVYLVVVFTDRSERDETIRRIISARPAAQPERRRYDEAIARTG